MVFGKNVFDVTAWYRYLFPGTPVPNSLGDYDSTQVDISRKMSRFKIRLRDREEARRSRGGVVVTDPHRLRGDGSWIRLSSLGTRK